MMPGPGKHRSSFSPTGAKGTHVELVCFAILGHTQLGHDGCTPHPRRARALDENGDPQPSAKLDNADAETKLRVSMIGDFLGPRVKVGEKVSHLTANVWQKSRHWDTSAALSSVTGTAVIFTDYF